MKNQDMNDETIDPPKDKITNADNEGFTENPKTSDAEKQRENENVSSDEVISEKAIVNSEINPTDKPLK